MSRAARVAPTTIALLAVMQLGGPAPLTAQTVQDIVERMYDAYAAQAERVDNYTIVQSMMGFEASSYFEKQIVDGRPVYRLLESDMGGVSFGLGAEDAGIGDVFLWGDELIEHGRYAGREQIGQFAVHVLAVDDLSQLDLARPTTPQDMEFEPKTARIYVDDQLLVPRRMEYTGDAITDTGPHEVTVRVDMENYLPIEGLLVPYRTVIDIQGLGAAMDPEMRAELEQMEEQLAALPPDQRAMMERMLGAQLDQLRQMMDGGGDGMTMEITVVDVAINAGR